MYSKWFFGNLWNECVPSKSKNCLCNVLLFSLSKIMVFFHWPSSRRQSESKFSRYHQCVLCYRQHLADLFGLLWAICACTHQKIRNEGLIVGLLKVLNYHWRPWYEAESGEWNGSLLLKRALNEAKIWGLALLHRKPLLSVWLQQAFTLYMILCLPGVKSKAGQLLVFTKLLFPFYIWLLYLYVAEEM